MTDPLPARATRAGESTLLRLTLIALVIVALLVPLALVRGLLAERRQRGSAAAAEIADAWGGQQTLAPPVLRLAWLCTTTGEKGEPIVRRVSQVALPDRLSIGGTLAPESRARGIFSTFVYRAALRVQGELVAPAPPTSLDCPAPTLESALVTIGLGDNRGIDRLGDLGWNRGPLRWNAGGIVGGPWQRGLFARVDPATVASGTRLPFGFELDLRGSESLALLPVGRETTVELDSEHPAPSFQGAFLPTQRAVEPSGFSARWRISPYARSFAESFFGDAPPKEIAASAFGVELAAPVDGYLQTERAQKYAILVIGLVFLACFLLELATPSPLHPVHYLLVGAALALFYLLLLALSEHLGFDLAFALAASAVTLLLALYVSALLSSVQRGALFAGVVGSCYGGLYVLLGREEYALLAGSIGTFLALALTMWTTRRIDWRTAFASGGAPREGLPELRT